MARKCRPLIIDEPAGDEEIWARNFITDLMEIIQPLEAAENTTEAVTEVKQMIEDNIQVYNDIKKAKLNGEEIDEDWAEKSTGSALIISAPIRTPMLVETHANSQWRTCSPLTRSLRPPRTRGSLRTIPRTG